MLARSTISTVIFPTTGYLGTPGLHSGCNRQFLYFLAKMSRILNHIVVWCDIVVWDSPGDHPIGHTPMKTKNNNLGFLNQGVEKKGQFSKV